MIEVGKYNHENINADFDSDLVVEGVVLEILSLNKLLKIFKNSAIVNLTTEALKPLLLLLNHYQSRCLYFRDCICQLQSRFKVLVLLEIVTSQSKGWLGQYGELYSGWNQAMLN